MSKKTSFSTPTELEEIVKASSFNPKLTEQLVHFFTKTSLIPSSLIKQCNIEKITRDSFYFTDSITGQDIEENTWYYTRSQNDFDFKSKKFIKMNGVIYSIKLKNYESFVTYNRASSSLLALVFDSSDDEMMQINLAKT